MANTVSRKVSDETLNRIITVESAGNPNAKAPTSSATGLGQFINATWLGVVRKHRPDLFNGRSDADVLALRRDPSLSIEMLARFTEDNLAVLGSGATDGDIYLAHFSGVGTARKVLRSDQSLPTTAVFRAAAITANRSILAGKTLGQVRAWANAKMAKAGGRDWVAKFYVGKTNPPAVEKAKDTVIAGGGVVVGGAVAAGVQQGWPPWAWLILLAIVAGAVVVGILLLRHIRRRRAEKTAVEPPLAVPERIVEPVPAVPVATPLLDAAERAAVARAATIPAQVEPSPAAPPPRISEFTLEEPQP